MHVITDEVKLEVLPINHDVTGQFAKPRDRRCEQPHRSDSGNQDTDDDKTPRWMLHHGDSICPMLNPVEFNPS